MTITPAELASFRMGAGTSALVAIEEARGSTPRERGAFMIVAESGTLGTIGGGQLEFMAIDAARAMLARGETITVLDIPLGPEIGQCCGGRTRLSVARLETAGWERLIAAAEAEARGLPEIVIFGAGHVGRALAAALALLPVRARVVDQRADALELVPSGVATLLTPIPEQAVRDAAAGAAFVIATHDHAIDFLIAREALLRGDAAYVGMIGSRTKLASFRRWLAVAEGPAPDISALLCPIGAAGRPDKRPEVIAAFVAAELLDRVVVRPRTTSVA